MGSLPRAHNTNDSSSTDQIATQNCTLYWQSKLLHKANDSSSTGSNNYGIVFSHQCLVLLYTPLCAVMFCVCLHNVCYETVKWASLRYWFGSFSQSSTILCFLHFVVYFGCEVFLLHYACFFKPKKCMLLMCVFISIAPHYKVQLNWCIAQTFLLQPRIMLNNCTL